MKRNLVLAYGAINYVVFLGVFLYLVGFLGNFLVPKSVDAPATAPLGVAIAVDVILIALFGVQHSVMARPGFKRWWTKFVPHSIERSTYVLATNVVLVLLIVFWQPFGPAIWDLQSSLGRGVAYVVFALGWAAVLGATLLINHFDLFGLRQVWLRFRDRPYTGIGFRMPGPYRFVRHPLYVGWLLTFWATPTMTPGHLLFAAGMTAYILIAIRYEERDLAAYHGPEYVAYRERTPMLVPGLPRENSSRQAVTAP